MLPRLLSLAGKLSREMPVALLQAYHRLDMEPLRVPDTPMAVCHASSQERHASMHYTALARLPSCLLHLSIDRYSFRLHIGCIMDVFLFNLSNGGICQVF